MKQYSVFPMGQLAEYHLNYPFARWRYIFEVEALLLTSAFIRLLIYGTLGIFYAGPK